MPINYLVLGLITAAFPAAKIIHVRRHPVDTCLSVWTTANRTPPLWSHNMSDVVFAYREYSRQMRYWRDAISMSSMLDIDYEDVVSDHESSVRRIISFLELEWEEECLRHESNSNPISTPSLWQARQPIYSSSVGRWRKYEGFLGEFASLLDDKELDIT